MLAAAERSGALLVTLENLYGYGPISGGTPMTEDLPLDATTVKGRTRAAMTLELLAAAKAGRVRIAIGRASDFFGAGVTAGSTLGERVFANALVGRQADFIGNPDLPHTYSYVPDIAAGLAILGTDARAIGQVWHLPGPPTVTTREILDLLAGVVGHRVRIRSIPKLALRALGLASPLIRALAEMDYQFDEPFVLDTSKYQAGSGGRPRCPPPSPRPSPGTGPARHTMATKPEAIEAMPAPLISMHSRRGHQGACAEPGRSVVEAGTAHRRIYPDRVRRLLAGTGESRHRRCRRIRAARGFCRRGIGVFSSRSGSPPAQRPRPAARKRNGSGDP